MNEIIIGLHIDLASEELAAHCKKQFDNYVAESDIHENVIKNILESSKNMVHSETEELLNRREELDIKKKTFKFLSEYYNSESFGDRRIYRLSEKELERLELI